MKATTHIIFLELIILNLQQAIKLKNKFKNVDIEKVMKECFETSRDLIKDVEFAEYDYQQKKFLLPYITKLVNYLTEEELTLLNKRLKTVEVKKAFFSLSKGGEYKPETNELIYYYKMCVGHELIHLATSYYDVKRDLRICGFHFYNSKKRLNFGIGLNEGYTELLASRIFNKGNKPLSYLGLVRVCRMIELFFDEPADMRKLFFSCNLMGVIEKLKEYMPEEEVCAIIFDLDNNLRSGENSPSLRRVQAILYRRFMDKCTDENKRKEMDSLLSKDPLKKAIIKHMARKISETTAATNVNSVLKNRIRSFYKRAGAWALSYVSLMGLQNFNKNVAVPYNNARGLIENVASEDGMLDFNSTDYLYVKDKDGNIIDSFDGKYLSKVLEKENIKCCHIDEEFYTIDGSDVQINTYEAIKKEYYSEENLEIQNELHTDSLDGSYYAIENGIVYSYLPVTIKEIILSDGTIVSSKNSSNTYVSKELVDSQTISTKPYEDMTNQQLKCDYSENNNEISDVSYTLQYKKN